MTTKRSSTQSRRLLASNLILALAFISSPLWAEENTAATSPANGAQRSHTLNTSRNEQANDVSSSRINGRSDWDVDYPSQLAPQPVQSSRVANAVAQLPVSAESQL
ncbi:hypothetical protein [Dyella japonica]|uniref:Uncharacterized protein n=1 Tax=Dyella japonica TaxID=231455 RepID=A0ABV2JRQ6_9GAMM